MPRPRLSDDQLAMLRAYFRWIQSHRRHGVREYDLLDAFKAGYRARAQKTPPPAEGMSLTEGRVPDGRLARGNTRAVPKTSARPVLKNKFR